MSREAEYLAKKKQGYREKMDSLEKTLLDALPEIHCPVEHSFTNGMYIRKIFMPAGAIVSSKIHKTQHPYAILQGAVSVRINDEEWKLLEAGHQGITEPGTHRVLYIHFDTVWVTFHPNPNNITDLDELEEMIIEKHINKQLSHNKNPALCLG